MTGRHKAGAATYPGNVKHIVGEVKGPTTFGTYLVAALAEHTPALGLTRVHFETLGLDEIGGLVPSSEHRTVRVPT